MKLPQAWTSDAKPKATTASNTKVTARIDMSAEVAGAGLCPECRTPMEAAVAASVPVKTCHSCRIAIPTPDSEAPVGLGDPILS